MASPSSSGGDETSSMSSSSLSEEAGEERCRLFAWQCEDAAEERAALMGAARHLPADLVRDGQEAAALAKRGQGPRPQELADGTPVTARYWGITKAQVADFYETCCCDERWCDDDSMVRINAKFVAPLCQQHAVDGARMGVALLYNQRSPKMPTVFVSHAWSENANRFFEDIRDYVHDDEVPYICLLSNYQGVEAEISEQLGNNIHTAPFTQVLQSSACKRMLVVPNEELRRSGDGLYSRLWCVWEIYTAANLKLPIDITRRSSKEHLFGRGTASSRHAACTYPEDTQMIRAAIEMEAPRSLKLHMLQLHFVLLCSLWGLTAALQVSKTILSRVLGCFAGLVLGLLALRGFKLLLRCSGRAPLGCEHDSYGSIDGVIRGTACGLYSVRRLRKRQWPYLLLCVVLGCIFGLGCSLYLLHRELQDDYSSDCGVLGGSTAGFIYVATRMDLAGTRPRQLLKRVAFICGSIAGGCCSLLLTWSWTCLSYVDGFLLGEMLVFGLLGVAEQPLSLRLRVFMALLMGLFGWVGWEADGLCTAVICAPFGAMFGFSAALPEWVCLCQVLYVAFVLVGLGSVLWLNVVISSLHGSCTAVDLVFGTG